MSDFYSRVVKNRKPFVYYIIIEILQMFVTLNHSQLTTKDKELSSFGRISSISLDSIVEFDGPPSETVRAESTKSSQVEAVGLIASRWIVSYTIFCHLALIFLQGFFLSTYIRSQCN